MYSGGQTKLLQKDKKYSHIFLHPLPILVRQDQTQEQLGARQHLTHVDKRLGWMVTGKIPHSLALEVVGPCLLAFLPSYRKFKPYLEDMQDWIVRQLQKVVASAFRITPSNLDEWVQGLSQTSGLR